MNQSVILCPADSSFSRCSSGFEDSCQVQYVPARPDALQQHLPAAHGYYAPSTSSSPANSCQLAPHLRAIATPSTGLDHIDLQAAKERNIAVLPQGRPPAPRPHHRRRGSLGSYAGLHQKTPRRLRRRQTGHLGAYRIPRPPAHRQNPRHPRPWPPRKFMVAHYGQAFGLNVIACDLKPITLENVRSVSFDELLRQSDILSHPHPPHRRKPPPHQRRRLLSPK